MTSELSESTKRALESFKAAEAFVSELAALDCKPRIVQHRLDGLMYTSEKLPATLALDIFPRVTALLGAAFMRTVITGSLSGLGADVFVRVAERALALGGLAPICKALLPRVKCNKLCQREEAGDVLPKFDEHFAGEYAHLLKVCAFVLAHNYRGPTLGGP